jgi:glycosyltransferase 2 family protein
MSAKAQDVLNTIKPKRIIYPIMIGLAVAAYMLYSNFDAAAFKNITWTWQSSFWIFMALMMVVVRDLGYMIRIRILSDNKISWRNSFDVIMLWEFASALTPSIVGGTAVAIFIVNKEGINVGKSSAIVLITALMDEVFFVLMVPILFFLVGQANLFPVNLTKEIFGMTFSTKGLFYISYIIIVFYVLIIIYGLIFKPRGLKWGLLKIFKLPILRKWRINALQTGNEILIASEEIKGKGVGFWLKAFGATFFSWTARYWVVNFIILAFAGIGWGDHLLIYARQLVMWIIMLISPTPGGSGVAEFVFAGFLKEFTPVGLEAALALLWRLFSYYPYLFIGAIVLPRWIRRVFSSKKN